MHIEFSLFTNEGLLDVFSLIGHQNKTKQNQSKQNKINKKKL